MNGKEKVLVAQERMSQNLIYCFRRKVVGHEDQYMAEIRSIPEGSKRGRGSLFIKMQPAPKGVCIFRLSLPVYAVLYISPYPAQKPSPSPLLGCMKFFEKKYKIWILSEMLRKTRF